MAYKLGEYFRGFKPQDSANIPKLSAPETPETKKPKNSWSTIPIRMYVDSITGQEKEILLVAFSPRLRFVSKDLAQQILAKYSGFKRIKFLPKRFLPAPVEERIQVPLDFLI